MILLKTSVTSLTTSYILAKMERCWWCNGRASGLSDMWSALNVDVTKLLGRFVHPNNLQQTFKWTMSTSLWKVYKCGFHSVFMQLRKSHTCSNKPWASDYFLNNKCVAKYIKFFACTWIIDKSDSLCCKTELVLNTVTTI